MKRQYKKRLLPYAAALRKQETLAEGLLWSYLREKKVGRLKFRRQQPIGPYVVDFVCLPAKVIVELDGGQHNEVSERVYDERRDRFLQQSGFTVLRFWNSEVFKNCFGVLDKIYMEVCKRMGIVMWTPLSRQ